MIEFGVTILLLAMAAYIVCQIEPTANVLRAVQHHRQAQGDSVLNHAGLFDTEDEAADA